MTSILKPNEEQKQCIDKITEFINLKKGFSRFLINGSAGTGKTSILISSILSYLDISIATRYEYFLEAVKNNKWELLDMIDNFIIAAPTNKAKDVLISKYNSYLSSLETNEKPLTEKLLLQQIVQYKITFLTVSQVLSISRVINELGEEEFTKGNEKKIADKYNKPSYDKTIIIIDECSMLDTNTTRILGIIRCPIIFIGDYCQLPPVNEELSTIFNLEGKGSNTILDTSNILVYRLTKVERCKKDITTVANVLRDRIYDVIPDFNLLQHNSGDIIQYPKRLNKWINAYVNDIITKLNIIKTISNGNTSEYNCNSSSDSMALAWTNKCCSVLNQKIRENIYIHNLKIYEGENEPNPEFETIENINQHFIIKGDKLLVKSPYYKYGHKIYSSSIVYVAKLQKTNYRPLIFYEWCDLANRITSLEKAKKNSNTIGNSSCSDNIINLDAILDDHIDASINKNSTTRKQKTVLDYFSITNTDITNGSSNSSNSSSSSNSNLENVEQEKQELLALRNAFFEYHTLANVTSTGLYNFIDSNGNGDIVSKKFNTICSEFKLEDIQTMSTTNERYIKYTKWHHIVSKELFGIPLDKVHCRKCLFFIDKFKDIIAKSGNIAEMINATENIVMNMFIADLAVLNTSGSHILHHIPILDMLDKNNLDVINTIRNIIKNSYEVKITLQKKDLGELKTINKILGEDTTDIKYITMSQMLGHYLQHVFTSIYLEVDHGYALTVHKSQGSTYNDVFIDYINLQANQKIAERHRLLYTAITRCANKLHIYC